MFAGPPRLFARSQPSFAASHTAFATVHPSYARFQRVCATVQTAGAALHASFAELHRYWAAFHMGVAGQQTSLVAQQTSCAARYGRTGHGIPRLAGRVPWFSWRVLLVEDVPHRGVWPANHVGSLIHVSHGGTLYTAARRTREMGIRLAIGARRQDVRKLVLQQGGAVGGTGVGMGLVAAAGFTRLIAALLFGVTPVDLVTYGAVSLLLLAVVLLASYVPARRAAAVDPVEALRWE